MNSAHTHKAAAPSPSQQDAPRSLHGSVALQELIDILREPFLRTCVRCCGTGRTLSDHHCPVCDGAGKVRNERF